MPNITIPNFVYPSLNEEFSSIWKMTRAMKAVGWRYKASSDSSAKETTGDPNLDKWGAGTIVPGRTATGAFTIGTPTSTKEMGRVTVSGGTIAGFTSSGGLSLSGSIGRFLKITGATNSANNGTWQIVKFNSSTSVDIVNPAAVAETTPGGSVWQELDSLLDAYPAAISGASGTGAWWCAQGPSMLKIPIGTGVPTGVFIKGEVVTQAVTGATGNIIGVLTDTSGGLGYIVVEPRNSGTGAGQRGWGNTNAINAQSAPTGSGATVTPTGATLEYIQEIVFWKGNQAQSGHIYIQCIDVVNEVTTSSTVGRFSTLATLGTATAVICPGGASGGSPLTNGFPTIGTFVWLGTGGSGAAATGQVAWRGDANAVVFYSGHILVANCMDTDLQASDGSLTWLQSTSNSGNGGSYHSIGYLRMENQEDGDIWPFVTFFPVASGALYSATRATATSVFNGAAATGADMMNAGNFVTTSGTSNFKGWMRRGFSSGDAFQEFQGFHLNAGNSTITAQIGTDRIACSFESNPPQVREPIWIASVQATKKMRKGTIKWWFLISSGRSNQPLDGGKYIQVSSGQVPVCVGPWNSVSIPGL